MEGATLAQCKQAANALRSGMGVQVMALPYAEGVVEIGCNLQATAAAPTPRRADVDGCVRAQLPTAASLRGYVVGFAPEEALLCEPTT